MTERVVPDCDTPEGQWAMARGFDLKAPHWNDLDPVIRESVRRIVANCPAVPPVPVEREPGAWDSGISAEHAIDEICETFADASVRCGTDPLMTLPVSVGALHAALRALRAVPSEPTTGEKT